MSSENPYASSKLPSDTVSSTSAAPLLWSVVTVFGSTLVGGAIGLGVGLLLGTLLPDYYRSVFSNGGDQNFDPVAVGIGQGLTQGIVFGAVIGLAIVAMFYWHRLRTVRNHGKPND